MAVSVTRDAFRDSTAVAERGADGPGGQAGPEIGTGRECFGRLLFPELLRLVRSHTSAGEAVGTSGCDVPARV